MTEKEKVAIGVTSSLVVHLLVVLTMIVWVRIDPQFLESKDPKPEEILELVLEPDLAQRLAAMVAPTPERRVIDTSGLEETETAPEDALFESDKNSRASSASDPTGTARAPSQEGRERDVPQFQNRRALDGAPDAAPGVASLPQPNSPQLSPAAPPPLARPTPVAAEPTPQLAQATPTAATPAPEATPTASESGVMPRPTPRAVAAATPQPTPVATPTPKPTELAAVRPSNPRPPSAPGYQAQSDLTQIEGNISNRGRAGLDSRDTPLGRYQKTLAAAIGSRWNYYVMRHMDLIEVGNVQVHFFISREGRASNVTVRESTSNTAFESFCVQAITAADIPPIPPEVVPVLEQNRLEITYTFTIYPN